uniref:Uncharacterized protein n=1 Tax=Paramoeba aestuarina TaxID=180227 RepID=A0A7S4P9C9_9EUKA|mmetsp:Transcript_38575/g.61155  ORF Transcript_38575/g.61155 Transcript_38575/m.61155 type:complete len:694 (+) Transcript_38575:82-2163(+)
MGDHEGGSDEKDKGQDLREKFSRSRADTPRDLGLVLSKMKLQEGHGPQELHPPGVTDEDVEEAMKKQQEKGQQEKQEGEEGVDTQKPPPPQEAAPEKEEARDVKDEEHEDYEQEYEQEREYEYEEEREYEEEEEGEYEQEREREYEREYCGGDSREVETPFDDEDDGYRSDPIDENKDQCLARLLEVEDFLTELLLGKPSLMQLLREPEVIKELITFSLGMPNPHSDNEDLSEERMIRVERRTDVAFQTLSSDFVLEVVITDEDLLDHLFAYLDAPTGKKESNHFSRIVMVFLDRYSHDLMLYLRSRDGIVMKIVRNVEDQTIVDLLYKFVDAGITHQWLYEENLLKLLVDGLNEAKSISSHRRGCLAQVASDVLHFCCRWASNSMLVSEVMENESLTTSLLGYTLSEGPDRPERLKEGLIIFSIMLQLLSSESSQEEEPPFIRLLCENIPLFISLLQIVPPYDQQQKQEEQDPSNPDQPQNNNPNNLATDVGGFHSLQTSAGLVTPTIGTLRLQIADFFCALLYCGFPVLQTYLPKFLDLFPLCVDLLFHYKWNNILHNVLTRILSAVFECSDEEMIVKVLDQTQLLKRLVAAFNDEVPTGNKGHLLQLCQECLRAAQVSSLVADYTYNFPVWEEFVSGRLDDILSEQEPQMEEEADDGFIGYDEIVDPRWIDNDNGYDDNQGEEYYDETGL